MAFFNKLDVPHQWETYWSKYPQGYTILDALINWVRQVNEMSDNLNDMNVRLDDFIKSFDENIQQIVIDQLNAWFIDGTLAEIINEQVFGMKADIEWVQDQIDGLFITSTQTITVGSGGDHPTITAAISEINLKKPGHNDAQAIIQLLSGFVLTEQVIVKNMDLSWISITSIDPVVKIARQALTTTYSVNQSPAFTVQPAFYVQNGALPNIDVLFDMDTSGVIGNSQTGIFVDNGRVLIAAAKGVLNATYCGAIGINGSNIVGNYANFSGAGNREALTSINYGTDSYGDGVRVWNSSFNGAGAICNDVGDVGFNISKASKAMLNDAIAKNSGHHGLLVTGGSGASANDGDFSDSLDDNITVYAGSSLDARRVIANDAVNGSGIVVTRASQANVEEGVFDRCGNGGIFANSASQVNADGAKVRDGGDHNVVSSNGSQINFNGGTSTGSLGDNLHTTHMGFINGSDAILDNAGRNGAMAYAGELNVHGASILNAGNNGIEATRGGRVACDEANTTGATTWGIAAYGGAIIQSGTAFIGTTNIVVNELNPGNGLILS